MKKILFFFIIALTVTVSSCKKDDNTTPSENLAGTTWIFSNQNNSLGITINFISNSQLSFISEETNDAAQYYLKDEYQGLYKINGTTFTADLVAKVGGGKETIDGIFEGNTLSILYFGQMCALKKQ